MARNSYETLITGRGVEPDSQEASQLAGRLRGRQARSTLAQLSGDSVLAPYGAKEAKAIRAQAEGMRQSSLSRAKEKLEREKLAQDQAQHEDTMARYDADRAQRLKLAQLKSDAEDYNKLSDKRAGELQNVGDIRRGVAALAKNMDELKVGKWAPGVGQAMKLAGQYGMGNQAQKDRSNWWAQYQRIYELPERNRMFGATLSPSEEASWAGANINPGMSGEQIKQNLEQMLAIYERKSNQLMKGGTLEKYDPRVLEEYLGMENTMFGQSAEATTQKENAEASDPSTPGRKVEGVDFSV